MTRITPRRGTDFIEITVKHKSKPLAILVANTIAQTSVEHSQQISRNRAERALEALDDEITAQSVLVQDHRKELTILIQQYGIPINSSDNSSPLSITEKEMLENVGEKLPRFKERQTQTTIQIQKLTELSGEALIRYAAGLDLPENQVPYHYSQYLETKNQRLALIAEGLKTNHPNLLALDERAKNLMAEAHKEATSLKANLETKFDLISRQVKRLNEMLKTSEKDLIGLSLAQNQYNQAKEAYEQSRAMLRDMKIKQQEARVLLKRPHSPVTIHEYAQ